MNRIFRSNGQLTPHALFKGGGYLGPIAGGTRFPTSFNATNKQYMSESFHRATDTVSAVRLVFANAYLTGAGSASVSHDEAGTGAAADITASIVVDGVFHQALFGGSAVGSIPSNALLVSDTIPVSLGVGQTFAVREWRSCSAGIVFSGSPFGTQGSFAFGVSGITDRTMGGSISAATANTATPCAILGQTRKGTVALLGTSRLWGQGDTRGVAPDDIGSIAPALQAAGIGTINLGLQGDRIAHFAYNGTNALRRQLIAYCSHMHIEYGINDLGQGRTAAQLAGDVQAVINLTGKPTTIQTIEPHLPAQTGPNAQRVTYNDAVRAGVSNVRGYFEIADVLETARNSGLWNAAYTADNLHANAAGYAAIEASGAISTGLYT